MTSPYYYNIIAQPTGMFTWTVYKGYEYITSGDAVTWELADSYGLAACKKLNQMHDLLEGYGKALLTLGPPEPKSKTLLHKEYRETVRDVALDDAPFDHGALQGKLVITIEWVDE